MTYRVDITGSALRELLAAHPKVRARVQHRIDALANDPRPPNAEPLKGDLKGLWRLRVGEYRVIYEIDDKQHVVTVGAIGPRGAVYT